MSITLVQSRSISNSGSLAFNSSVTSGNLIVVVVHDSGHGAATITCSDGVNTYSSPGGHTSSGSSTSRLFYVLNCTGGSLTITATSSGTVTELAIHEFSGVASFDQTTFTAGTGNTQDSGNITTTVAAELIFGYEGGASALGQNSVTAGGTYTQAEKPDVLLLTQYKVVSSTGTYSSNTTTTTGKGGGASWVAEVISFYGDVNVAGVGAESTTAAGFGAAVVGPTPVGAQSTTAAGYGSVSGTANVAGVGAESTTHGSCGTVTGDANVTGVGAESAAHAGFGASVVSPTPVGASATGAAGFGSITIKVSSSGAVSITHGGVGTVRGDANIPGAGAESTCLGGLGEVTCNSTIPMIAFLGQ